MSKTTQLDKALKAFTLTIKPSSSREAEARSIANEIFEHLRQKSRYDIDRVQIGGSSGKKTTAHSSYDLDLVIFVNDQEPPFDHVLSDFVSVLCCTDVTVVKQWPNSVELKYRQFEIDLLAAPNKTNHMAQQPSFKTLAAMQAYETLQTIQDDPANYYQYSTSLVETQLNFVRVQSAFIHDLIRLCKYWTRQINMDDFSGRSALVELIAIKAGQEQEAKSQPSSWPLSLLEAFEKFLDKMENFENLLVEFNFDPIGAIRNTTSWRQFGGGNCRSRPFVRDPANPDRNMAERVSSKNVGAFKKAAKNTKSKLNGWNGESIECLLRNGTSDGSWFFSFFGWLKN